MSTTTEEQLQERHLKDLKGSGLTDATIQKYDFSSISQNEATGLLGFTAPSPGWLIRYPGSTFFKFKPDRPYKDSGMKYLSPKGTAQDLFITNLAAKSHDDISLPYYFTEGEKKCMALEQAGYAAIGVSGVWNWISNGHYNEKLSQINLDGRVCCIIYDSDKYGNKNVLLAETRFATALRSFGATVKIVDMKPEFGKGADDQLLVLKEKFDAYLQQNTRDYVQKPADPSPKSSSDVLADDEMAAFEARIKIIPENVAATKLPAVLDPILKEIAGHNVAQGDAILRHVIKEHFGFKDADLRSYEKVLKGYRKEDKRDDEPKSLSKEEIIEKMREGQDRTLVHPAQDYVDGRMVFAVMADDTPCIITSDRKLFTFTDAKEQGLVLRHDTVDESRFSSEGVQAFCSGGHEVKVSVLYKKVYDYVKRFIRFPGDTYLQYVALWVIGTYVFMLFRYYPYGWIRAPKRSGKSLLMEVLQAIAFNGAVITKPTEAVLYRDIENNLTTMFIDEFERLEKQDKNVYEALQAILNVGFSKPGTVKRCEPTGSGAIIVRKYSSYSPKMFAGISDIDDVLQDRTVRIKLLRKKENEDTKKYRHSREIQELQRSIRDDLYIFALTYAGKLSAMYDNEAGDEIKGLDHLNNRELDIWEPIILLANLIDAEDPTLKLTEKMMAFSEMSMEEKHADSLDDNDSYKAQTVFKEMLDEISPLQVNGDIQTFNSDLVFSYFQKSTAFSWLLKKNSLTKRLKAIDVRSGQATVDGKKLPVYVVDIKMFRDLCERYVKGEGLQR